MVPADDPPVSVIVTVTCTTGSVWCTSPDQAPARAAGIVAVTDGEGDASLADDAVRLSDVDRSALLQLPWWCMKMKVLAVAIAATHATQALTQPTRRAVAEDRVMAGNSSVALPGLARGKPRAAARACLVPSASRPAAGSLRPSRVVTTPRAGGRLAGSGARQAATVLRSGSGRKFRSCGPMAGRPAAANSIVCAHASMSADGVAEPYGGVMLK